MRKIQAKTFKTRIKLWQVILLLSFEMNIYRTEGEALFNFLRSKMNLKS